MCPGQMAQEDLLQAQKSVSSQLREVFRPILSAWIVLLFSQIAGAPVVPLMTDDMTEMMQFAAAALTYWTLKQC